MLRVLTPSMLSNPFHIPLQLNLEGMLALNATRSASASKSNSRPVSFPFLSSVLSLPPSTDGKPRCTLCNGIGHTIDKCFDRNRYPPGYRQRATGLDS